MLGVAFEFDGVLTLTLVIPIIALVAILAWLWGRALTRKFVTRTIANQIWSPERRGCLKLLLSTGVEISPSGYSDGTFTFDYPRGAIPTVLRFREARISFYPHCLVDVGGVSVNTNWRAGGERSGHFHDLNLEGIKRGDRVDCTFSCLETSGVFPYIRPRYVEVSIVPPKDDDATVGAGDGEETLP